LYKSIIEITVSYCTSSAAVTPTIEKLEIVHKRNINISDPGLKPKRITLYVHHKGRRYACTLRQSRQRVCAAGMPT
jgi:hypothetical protein